MARYFALIVFYVKLIIGIVPWLQQLIIDFRFKLYLLQNNVILAAKR